MRGAGRRQLFGAQRAPAVGIAHALQAFPVGRLQRQGIGRVGRRIRAAACGLDGLLQQTQGMRQGRSTGELWCRVHRAAAIGNCQRLAPMGAEGCKVLDRQRAAARLHIGRDGARQVALVEIARPPALPDAPAWP